MFYSKLDDMMSCAILISIHPEHARDIIAGKKLYEYRKVLPARNISYLVLYSTAPVKKITAVVEVKDRLVDSLQEIWKKTSEGSGISHQLYLDYYSDRRIACAFALGNVYQIENPIGLSDLPGCKTSPQLFYYLDDLDMKFICKFLTPHYFSQG